MDYDDDDDELVGEKNIFLFNFFSFVNQVDYVNIQRKKRQRVII